VAVKISETRMAELRDKLGEPEAKIKILQPDWAKVQRELVRVKLNIHWWKGTTQLAEGDLGLEGDQEFRQLEGKIIKLGNKKLLPVDVINNISRIEQRGRKALERFSYETGEDILGNLVPIQSFALFKANITEHQKAFFELRDYIYDNYDEIVDRVCDDYALLAYKAWDIKTRGASRAEKQAVAEFVGKIRALIPSREAIYDSFRFDWDIWFLDLPKTSEDRPDLEEEVVALQNERARVERELKRYEEQLKLVKENRQFAEERERLESQKRQLLQEEEAKRELLTKANEAYQKTLEGSLGVFQAQLCELIYQVTTDARIALENARNKTGGNIGRTSIQLKGFIEQVRALNFFTDQEAGQRIEGWIKELDKTLQIEGPARDYTSVKSTLDEMRAFATEILTPLLGRAPRTQRENEYVNVIPEAGKLLRRGRRLDQRAEREEVLVRANGERPQRVSEQPARRRGRPPKARPETLSEEAELLAD
jgi:hypothetical protein